MARIDYQKRYEQARKHPCSDCGKLICRQAVRCRKCNIKNMWKTRSRTNNYIKGNKNPNWKGGVYLSQSGYWYIRKAEHHRTDSRGYVAMHILAWEEAHGKPLPNGWVIHHLNGIKTDNRSVNLVALPKMKHYLVLSAKAKRIQELEALLNHQNQLV